jgi:hypothetical protein
MSTLATTPRFDAIEQHPDDAVTAYTYMPTDEPTMRALAQELFGTYWRSVVVGPCIEGAVFEVSFQSPPEIRYLDGYLTVDLGPWHFHLCLGPHKGNSSAELREKRLKTPDWSRLDAYYRLRAQFLGEAMPDDFEAVASQPLPERI